MFTVRNVEFLVFLSKVQGKSLLVFVDELPLSLTRSKGHISSRQPSN